MDHWGLSRAAQHMGYQGHSSGSFPAQTTTPNSVASAQQTYAQQQAAGGYASNHGGGSQQSAMQQSVAYVASARGSQQTYPSSLDSRSSVAGGTSGTAGGANQYGGQYDSAYGTSTQLKGAVARGVTSDFQGSTVGGGQGGGLFADGSSSVNGSVVYGIESAKFKPGGSAAVFGGVKAIDYSSSSPHGHILKSDQYASGYNLKSSEYISLEREQYGKSQGAYTSGDLQSDIGRRYPDAVAVEHSRQIERSDQAQVLRHQQVLQAQQLQSSTQSRHNQLLRQQQLLQAQQLQSGAALRQTGLPLALEGNSRSTDYLTGRSNSIHSGSQEYGAGVRDMLGRSIVDGDPALLGSFAASDRYLVQQPGSVLGGIEGRNLGGSLYGQGSSAAAYGGVGLPPGRDYSAAKGIVGGHGDDRRDDRGLFGHNYDRREDDLLREREREREHERERDRERERKREVDRLREREIERRLREREQEYELRRRDPTPPKAPRVRRLRSLPRRDSKVIRRDSPHREVLHRHGSPLKERRREYICKIQSHCLVEAERDFSSVSKRYSKLYVAPEFSKLVACWLEAPGFSIGKPVSFEHNAIEVEDESNSKETSSKSSDKAAGAAKPPKGSTVWNSKIILMSGISEGALEELLSDRNPVDKIVHIHNVIKFAVLRKGKALFAAGGPWNKDLDGGDPSTDDGALIRTALRCIKDSAQLDLAGCQEWKRFVEVHYDRIGEDGLPSYKEINVFFIPDLSPCLPSFEKWEIQWNEQRKARLDMEKREAASRKEKAGNAKATDKDFSKGKSNATKAAKENRVGEVKIIEGDAEKGNEEQAKKKEQDEKKEKEQKTDEQKEEECEDDKKGHKENDKKGEKGDQKMEEKKDKDKDGKDTTETTGEKKAGKKGGKKVLKKNKKGKEKVEKNNEKEEKKDKKTEDENEVDKKGDNEVKVEEEKDKDGKEGENEVKVEEKNDNGDKDITKTKGAKKGGKKGEKKGGNKGEKDVKMGKSDKDGRDETKGKDIKMEKDKDKDGKDGIKGKNVKMDEKDKDGKDGIKGKDVKMYEKDKDVKIETKGKSSKERKGHVNSEEPPPYPGLFLTTKRSKNSKIRSMSISLDGLLDYDEKDTDESTLELSLFAEVFREMLQYQLGNLILASLEVLRQRVCAKRKEERKRKREDKSGKEMEGNIPLQKHSKFSDKATVDAKCDDESAKLEQDEEKSLLVDESEANNDGSPTHHEAPEFESNSNEQAEKDVKAADEEMKDASQGKEKSSQEEKKDDQKANKVEKLDNFVREVIIDKDLLKAYRYFDQNRVGYIKVEDLRRILHSLGKLLSNRNIKELVSCALLESNKSRDERIIYQRLVGKEVEM